MREKGKDGSPRRLLTAAAVLMAVLLAATAGYSAARYATESGAQLSVGVDSFDVTSEMTYTDAWGEGKAFNGNLGTMVFPSSGGIAFTITVTNKSAVAVTCSLSVNAGYKFSSSGLSGCSLSGGVITMTGSVAADGGTGTASFTVERDTSHTFDPDGNYTDVDVYSRDLEITVTYEQAE